jgi:FixJ family two-component response regulator
VVRLSNTTLISIVDDDESFRTAVRDMVESFGYTVTAFASGVEFLGSDRLRDSACLITDVRMPGMSGFELHDRTVAAGYSIPTIFMTAFPDQKGSDRATKAGAIAYLSKPCHRGDLLARINSTLDRGKADRKGS